MQIEMLVPIITDLLFNHFIVTEIISLLLYKLIIYV